MKFIIVFGLISFVWGVGAVVFNFWEINVVAPINITIIAYSIWPDVIALNGVVPSIRPNKFSSNITGTLLLLKNQIIMVFE